MIRRPVTTPGPAAAGGGSPARKTPGRAEPRRPGPARGPWRRCWRCSPRITCAPSRTGSGVEVVRRGRIAVRFPRGAARGDWVSW